MEIRICNLLQRKSFFFSCKKENNQLSENIFNLWMWYYIPNNKDINKTWFSSIKVAATQQLHSIQAAVCIHELSPVEILLSDESS